MLRRVLLSLCLLMMSVAGLTITNATPASAGLSPIAGRKCMNFDSSNNRRLSICARGWVPDDGAYQWRGVVEMHTYILVNGHPVDRTSQSITVNQATFWPTNSAGTALFPSGIDFGQDFGSNTCRVNSPTSSQITCSVPNTYRVAFYSKAWNGVAQGLKMDIYKVSWRDDVGQPHIVQSGSPSSPDHLPLHFVW
jgi:hypothetical protein